MQTLMKSSKRFLTTSRSYASQKAPTALSFPTRLELLHSCHFVGLCFNRQVRVDHSNSTSRDKRHLKNGRCLCIWRDNERHYGRMFEGKEIQCLRRNSRRIEKLDVSETAARACDFFLPSLAIYSQLVISFHSSFHSFLYPEVLSSLPSNAMAIAMLDSVTVSMGLDTIGVFRQILRVKPQQDEGYEFQIIKMWIWMKFGHIWATFGTKMVFVMFTTGNLIKLRHFWTPSVYGQGASAEVHIMDSKVDVTRKTNQVIIGISTLGHWWRENLLGWESILKVKLELVWLWLVCVVSGWFPEVDMFTCLCLWNDSRSPSILS